MNSKENFFSWSLSHKIKIHNYQTGYLTRVKIKQLSGFSTKSKCFYNFFFTKAILDTFFFNVDETGFGKSENKEKVFTEKARKHSYTRRIFTTGHISASLWLEKCFQPSLFTRTVSQVELTGKVNIQNANNPEEIKKPWIKPNKN